MTLAAHVPRHVQSRNFALNPGEGLKVRRAQCGISLCVANLGKPSAQIRPYKKAGTPEGAQDDQLQKLGRYVCAVLLKSSIDCILDAEMRVR